MMKLLRFLFPAVLAMLLTGCDDPDGPTGSVIVRFDSAVLPAAGYVVDHSYTEQEVVLENRYDPEQATWGGFALSSLHDRTTAGPNNQYSVYTSAPTPNTFAVGYYEEYISKPAVLRFLERGGEHVVRSVDVCNSTYTALAARDGTAFNRAFVEGDYLVLTLTGYNASAVRTGSVECYLIDYRNGRRSILSEWTTVDCSSLGSVRSIAFTLDSSDRGEWGMNTPSYFCLDNVIYE